MRAHATEHPDLALDVFQLIMQLAPQFVLRLVFVSQLLLLEVQLVILFNVEPSLDLHLLKFSHKLAHVHHFLLHLVALLLLLLHLPSHLHSVQG